MPLVLLLFLQVWGHKNIHNIHLGVFSKSLGTTDLVAFFLGQFLLLIIVFSFLSISISLADFTDFSLS